VTEVHLLYLVVMVAIILTVTAIGANALLLKRCPQCKARNSIDAAQCRKCGAHLGSPGR
jgi:ribosomal protein L40E